MSYLQKQKFCISHAFVAIMTDAKFQFNQLMLTLIFGIRASEPPPPPSGPGERLKRPGLVGLISYLWYLLSKCYLCCPGCGVQQICKYLEINPAFDRRACELFWLWFELSKCIPILYWILLVHFYDVHKSTLPYHLLGQFYKYHGIHVTILSEPFTNRCVIE